MRRIGDLTGDEFFEFVFVIQPFIPSFLELDHVKAKIGILGDDALVQASMTLAVERDKESPDMDIIKNALIEIQNENANSLLRDGKAVMKLLLDNGNREIMYKALAIVEGVSVDEIRKYNIFKLSKLVKQIVKDINFKDFLEFADGSELTEPSATLPKPADH